MILRPTLKLARKLHESNLPALSPAASPYLDWHATLFTHHRHQHVLLVNSRSLFSVLLPGKGITSRETLIRVWMPQLGEMLERMGAQVILQRVIVPGLLATAVCKATDRRISGSVNEIVRAAKRMLESGNDFDVSLRLNELIYSYTNHERPSRLFLKMKAEELPEMEDPRDATGHGQNCECAKKARSRRGPAFATPSSRGGPSPS